MYTLFVDKPKNFNCDISIQGAKLSEAKARIILESKSVNVMFNGNITNGGKCVVPISKLKNLFENDTKGTIKLEVISEDSLFIPWQSDFIVEQSLVVKNIEDTVTNKPVEVNENKIKIEVNVNEDPTRLTKTEITSHVNALLSELTSKNINTKTIKNNITKTERVFEKYFRVKNIDTSIKNDLNEIKRQTLKMLFNN